MFIIGTSVWKPLVTQQLAMPYVFNLPFIEKLVVAQPFNKSPVPFCGI
jgi:hypothetical protein